MTSERVYNDAAAYALGKYEAIERRTKPADELRKRARQEFDENFNGQLMHLKQCVQRNQVPYKRGYRVGVSEYLRYGKSRENSNNHARPGGFKQNLHVQDNIVYQNMNKRLIDARDKAKKAKDGYLDEVRRSKEGRYDLNKQQNSWNKLVTFYQDAANEHDAKIDLDCSKQRAQDFINDDNDNWSQDNQADLDSFKRFHPDISDKKANQIMQQMNPDEYLGSSKYFDKAAVKNARHRNHMHGLMKKAADAISKLHSVERDIDQDGGYDL